MKIVLNCSNLRFGGGMTVGINIIKQLQKKYEAEYYLFCPAGSVYAEFFNIYNINVIIVPDKFHKLYFKPFLSSYLKSEIAKINPDLILSLGNIAIKTSITQILLIHQSYCAYGDSVVWKRLNLKFYCYMRLMVREIRRKIKYADLVLVQTQAMKKRVSSQNQLEDSRVGIFPNAVNLTSLAKVEPITYNDGEPIKLLFLSKYYPHKNFEILFELGKLIVAKKIPLTISITLDRLEENNTADFLKKITNLGLENVITNLGNIELADIAHQYRAHHGLFLPTLLESFSGTYIEAMHYNRAIFTSNYDFATEVCHDAAFYFDPVDADDILKVILGAFNNLDTIKKKVSLGRKYINSYETWDTLGDKMVEIIKGIKQ